MVREKKFVEALRHAEGELDLAFQQRTALDRRIAGLKRTIEGLSEVCGETGGRPEYIRERTFGLTDAIRKIFRDSDEPMLTPLEVRDGLRRAEVDLGRYSQPLVVIHNTLRRLESQRELAEFRDDNGMFRGYRMIDHEGVVDAEYTDVNRRAGSG